jgi:NTE family protein
MGAIQVGQAKALLAAGFAPDLVIGTSAGSLNAAWLAADPTERGADLLGRLWLDVRRRDIFPLRPLTIALGTLGRRDHLVPSAGLSRWLETHLPYRRLEEARIPLTVTVTDFDTGEPLYLSSGPAIPALVASCAIPGLYPPVQLDGRTLVDGGLSIEAPVEVAAAGGADRVFVLQTFAAPSARRPKSAGDVFLRSINLLLGNVRTSAVTPWAGSLDLYMVPAPDSTGMSLFSFRQGAALMAAARSLTEVWLPSATPLSIARRLPAGVRAVGALRPGGGLQVGGGPDPDDGPGSAAGHSLSL